MNYGNAERGPRQARAAIDAPATKQEHQQSTADDGVVHIVDHRVSSTVHVPTSAAVRLLRQTATAAGCEQGAGGGWIVYASRVERVVDALTGAGFRVVRTSPTTSSATSARPS